MLEAELHGMRAANVAEVFLHSPAGLIGPLYEVELHEEKSEKLIVGKFWLQSTTFLMQTLSFQFLSTFPEKLFFVKVFLAHEK
jgi:hypothetical protein